MNTSKGGNVLRLDIAVSGVIIGERFVSPQQPFVVGLLDDDAQEDSVHTHDLFRYVEGCWHLRLTRRIAGHFTDGKASLASFVLPHFNDVKEFMGKKRDKSDVWEVPLGPNARGRIQIGDFTIQFRFAVANPVLN